MTFYMTYARSRPDDIVPYAERHGIGLMTNAAHRWSENTDRFLDLWDYSCPHIVDSGGYNVQSNFGGYPWTVEEYHRWLDIQSDRFDWAACMDLACERRFDHLYIHMPVKERIFKTVENAIQHFNYDPEYKLLPVLQGWSVDEYVFCYDLMVDHGIPVEHVGLGTVCRISSSKEIVKTENAIREQCSKVERIHGFGVKINAFKLGATFDSADSQAWVYKPSNKAVVYDRWDHLEEVPMPDDSHTRTVESFKHYYSYASRLKAMANGGGQLEFPPNVSADYGAGVAVADGGTVGEEVGE